MVGIGEVSGSQRKRLNSMYFASRIARVSEMEARHRWKPPNEAAPTVKHV